MKKKAMVISVIVVLLALVWVGAVSAQGDTGYPIDDPTPEPTETKPPTAEPTDPAPTEAPPDPTEDPATPVPSETPVPPTEPVYVPTETAVPTQPPNNGDNPVCSIDREHPTLMALAERFEVPYEELVGYFCGSNWSVGEIALALTTLAKSDGSVDLPGLLALRQDEKMGWGQIWQSLELSGQDHGGLGLLKKDQDREQLRDQTFNEGEDSELQTANRSQKDKSLNAPPGQEKKEVEGSVQFVPPGQEGKTDDGKPGNGPKH